MREVVQRENVAFLVVVAEMVCDLAVSEAICEGDVVLAAVGEDVSSCVRVHFVGDEVCAGLVVRLLLKEARSFVPVELNASDRVLVDVGAKESVVD